MIRDDTHRAFAWRFLALLALLAAPLLQAAPQLYDVEVIVFTRDGAGGDDESMTASDEGNGEVPGTRTTDDFTALSSAAWRMNNISGGLAAARGYHVLFHRAWRQPGQDRDRAAGYPVHARADGGSLDGSITLIRERYLHLDVDLRLVSGGGVPALRPAFRLGEKRRIRSGELHYFDHPRFGVIALVTPYEPAEEPAAPEPESEGGAGAQEEEPVPADDTQTR
jgi:hypothetical protein